MIFNSIQLIKRSQARLVIAATVLFLGSTLFAAPQATTDKQAASPASTGKQAVVEIKGMSCPFCAYGAKKHLMKLPGAKKVDVTLGQDQAIADFAPDSKVTDDQIRKAVHDAGFTPGKIEWRNAGQGEKSGSSGTYKEAPKTSTTTEARN